MMEHVPYLSVPTLLERGSGVVRFGTAPDGLPFLTYLAPPPRAEELLIPVARALGVETPEVRYHDSPLEALVGQVNHLLHHQVLQTLPVQGKSAQVLVVARPVQRVCGTTLLERLFVGLGRSTQMQPAVAMNTAVIATNEAQVSVFRPGQICLAFNVVTRQLVLLRKQLTPSGWPTYTFSRPFLEESLQSFGDGHIEVLIPQSVGWRNERLSLHQWNDYVSLRQQAPEADWRLVLSTTTVARVLRNIVLAMARIHLEDQVHGDLKPSNVLLGAQAAHPIDSLELRPGMRSPAMTQSWAAPEQVLCGAVSPQTDQYSLGLMLLQLLRGVLYGEEARVSVPTGGCNVAFHTVLRNPGVYIDPETAPVQRSAIERWRTLVERCVKFVPEERFPSMRDLAEALDPLIAEATLHGQIEMPLTFGTLVQGDDGAGSVGPCWLTR